VDSDPEDSGNAPEVDPKDFLRALLKISPEDAAGVRAEASKKGGKTDRDDPQDGAADDYGDD
jgi:hypothetical protein